MRDTTPTDRGIAFIKQNANKTYNVYVAAAVDADNGPQDVFAMHLNRPSVDLDTSVKTVPAGAMSRTAEVVHVNQGLDGVVHVRPHRTDRGPLLAL